MVLTIEPAVPEAVPVFHLALENRERVGDPGCDGDVHGTVHQVR